MFDGNVVQDRNRKGWQREKCEQERKREVWKDFGEIRKLK